MLFITNDTEGVTNVAKRSQIVSLFRQSKNSQFKIVGTLACVSQTGE